MLGHVIGGSLYFWFCKAPFALVDGTYFACIKQGILARRNAVIQYKKSALRTMFFMSVVSLGAGWSGILPCLAGADRVPV